MQKILTIFLIWVVTINLFAFYALNRFNLQPDNAYIWQNPSEFEKPNKTDVIGMHAHWDSVWYKNLVEHGYEYHGPKEFSNSVFFPLYPALVWLVTFITPNVYLSGWIVSLVFLFASLWLLHKYIKEFHPTLNAELVLFILLIFPTAFFFNAVYTESLFLFLSIGAFYCTRKKLFLLAGLFCLAAALTRITGVFLLLPLLLEYLQLHNYKVRSLFHFNILPLFLGLTALFGFFYYHYLKFHDFFLFFKLQSHWGRSFAVNAEHFVLNTPAELSNFSQDLLFVLMGITLGLLISFRFRLSYGVYILLSILVPISTGTFMSIGRYMLVLFPIVIYVASWKNIYLKYAWIGASLLLLASITTLFVNNYWAG